MGVVNVEHVHANIRIIAVEVFLAVAALSKEVAHQTKNETDWNWCDDKKNFSLSEQNSVLVSEHSFTDGFDTNCYKLPLVNIEDRSECHYVRVQSAANRSVTVIIVI